MAGILLMGVALLVFLPVLCICAISPQHMAHGNSKRYLKQQKKQQKRVQKSRKKTEKNWEKQHPRQATGPFG